MRSFVFAIVALVLSSPLALAQPNKGKAPAHHAGPAGKGEPGKDEPEKRGKEGGDKGAPHAATDDDDEDDDRSATDGGKHGAERRTPAQMAFRKELWERREKAIEGRIHKGGKHLSNEGREAIRQHWLRISRLMRIRELAQADHADAIVKRVDAAIEREEKHCDAKIERLNAKLDGGEK